MRRERAMGLDKKNASDWVKGLPFLLVLGVLVGTQVFAVVLIVCIVALIVWTVVQVSRKNRSFPAAARGKKASRPSTAAAPDNRPLMPVTMDSDQPHSHSAKSTYDPMTGEYLFLDIQPCTCPNCGFVTDTSHRFCSRCDTDLTQPHRGKASFFRRKD